MNIESFDITEFADAFCTIEYRQREDQTVGGYYKKICVETL